MDLYYNQQKVSQLPVTGQYTIGQIKKILSDWLVPQGVTNYTIRLFFNNGTELSDVVFKTNTYDGTAYDIGSSADADEDYDIMTDGVAPIPISAELQDNTAGDGLVDQFTITYSENISAVADAGTSQDDWSISTLGGEYDLDSWSSVTYDMDKIDLYMAANETECLDSHRMFIKESKKTTNNNNNQSPPESTVGSSEMLPPNNKYVVVLATSCSIVGCVCLSALLWFYIKGLQRRKSTEAV